MALLSTTYRVLSGTHKQFLGRSGVESLLGLSAVVPALPELSQRGTLQYSQSTPRSFVRRRAHERNGPNAALSTVLRRAPRRIAALRQHSAPPLRQGSAHLVQQGTLGSHTQDQRLRLCSCADAIADPIADCGTNRHADRQRCALAGSHAAGQHSSRVPWPLQARSTRSPSRRPRARRGCGAARRARRMDARLPRRATRAKQLQQAQFPCSSARCRRHWATCGASAG